MPAVIAEMGAAIAESLEGSAELMRVTGEQYRQTEDDNQWLAQQLFPEV